STAHLHWAKRFLDCMRDPESAGFVQLTAASRYGADDAESRVRAKLTAFERGLESGVAPPLARSVAPRTRTGSWPRASLVWGRSGSLQMLLHDAIDQRRIIHFRYQGKTRIAEPHVLGIKNDRLQVLTWQFDGESSSGPLPGWRRFNVDELRELEVTES